MVITIICPDERTNERGGRRARKHNVFADTVGRKHKKDENFHAEA